MLTHGDRAGDEEVARVLGQFVLRERGEELVQRRRGNQEQDQTADNFEQTVEALRMSVTSKARSRVVLPRNLLIATS